MSLALEIREPLGSFELDVVLASKARAVGLFGPSGSGKTTVLEVVAGWRKPRAARVHFGGRTLVDTGAGVDLPTAARGVGYVPQDVLLFPHWTVWQNVVSGARRRGAPDAVLIGRVLEVLELNALRKRSVRSLSGGERRRVALARALSSRPELLLLDEPLGALDRPLRRRILPYLVRVREEFGVPMLFVSHDATEVEVLCDEVALLRDGRVVDQGPPADVFAGDEGARAVGADLENVVRGEVRAVGDGTATLALAGDVPLVVPRDGLEPGDRALVSVRSDDVLIATERPAGLSARNVLPARVLDVVDRDGEVLLRATLGPRERVSIQLTPAAVAELGLVPGRAVYLVIKTTGCRVLSAVP
jgi:molybdate transport system ATP-binding protein